MPKEKPNHVRRVKLSDYKDRKADEGAIEIETDDGQVWRVAPPELWPDDVLSLAERDDSVGAARLLIGERYDEFVKAGGSAMLVMSIVKDEHGISTPE